MIRIIILFIINYIPLIVFIAQCQERRRDKSFKMDLNPAEF